MDFKDYYATLGLTKTATDKEIKQAFRKLARKYHPDVNPGDKAAEARFKEINEANEVLSDADKRRKYDELGANWRAYENVPPGAQGFPGGFGGFPGRGAGTYTTGSGGQYRTVSQEEMEELLGGERRRLLGLLHDVLRRRRRGQRRRAADARAKPQPDRRRSRAPRAALARGGVPRRAAPDLAEARRPHAGDRRAHPGRRPRRGAGPRRPARASPAPAAARAGDLYLRVQVLPHARFERQGDDLTTRVEVPLTTAVLGGEAAVTTLAGTTVRLKVPPTTQNGQKFRVKGQGMPVPGKPEERGDLYVVADVQLPRSLTPEARAHYEALAQLGGARLTRRRRCRHEHQPFHREGPGGARRGPGRGRTGQPSADRSGAPPGGADRAAGRRRARRPAQAAGRPGRGRRRRAAAAGQAAQGLRRDPRRLLVASPRHPAEGRGRAGPLQGRVRQHRAPAAGAGQRIGPIARRRDAHASRRHLRSRARGADGDPRQPAGHRPEPRGQVPGARALRPRPDRAGAPGQARSGHRPRRGDPPRHPGAVAPHQEQPGADRRARRRQDGRRRGAGAAHHPRRRARGPQGQAHHRPRHGRAGRRREVSRRVRGSAEGGADRGHAVRWRGRALHRRAAHRRRRRRGRRLARRLEHAQADAGARRAAHHRRHHAERVPQAHREGRRARAPLPAGAGRSADRRGHDQHPARPARALRDPPRRPAEGLGAGRRRGAVEPLHPGSLPARQGDRSGRRGGVEAAHGDRLDAGRARRGRPAPDAARDRARGAAQGDRCGVARASHPAREGDRRAEGAADRA